MLHQKIGDFAPLHAINQRAKRENYLKRHYNKFKAIWNLGQPHTPPHPSPGRHHSVSKVVPNKKANSKCRNPKKRGLAGRAKRKQMFWTLYYAHYSLLQCFILFFIQQENRTVAPVVLAISSPLTWPKGPLNGKRFKKSFRINVKPGPGGLGPLKVVRPALAKYYDLMGPNPFVASHLCSWRAFGSQNASVTRFPAEQTTEV